ncbi:MULTISPECIES: host specificity protein J [Gammaproteobacteria]|uniref:host specificity protein J n=1 Tax=Gammaproteobacteria TaxID=1236 RepID=UPI002FC918FC
MNKNMLLPSGSKGGAQKPHTPVEMEDNLTSINKIKVLLAVSDGEVDHGFSLDMLYLNDVPVVGENGAQNYQGVKAEFRPGTQDQEYIKGFEDTASEVTVQHVLKEATPYIVSVTNKTLSALRFKIFMPRGVKTEENGDMVGVKVEYVIEVAVDGDQFREVLRDVIDGKTMSGYDRSKRVDMPTPEFTNQAIFRVRRVTPDSNDARLVDEIRLQSYAEVIDAKFRYPLTGILYVEFDSESFPQIPSISIKKKWKIVNVPSNYNPVTRTYAGTWDGTFKRAWSNNPAWVTYDLITSQRYGLDQRELGIPVDKWSLYQVSQYCDQMVPDGKGGQEPRYLCDVVIQSQIEAYTLVRDLCSIFRGMSFWNGESLSIVVDRPRDPSYIFTNDNVVNGDFAYTFASEKSMYTTCNVTFDDEQNMYSQDIEGVFDVEASLRFGHNPTSITAIGCTRRSEANRRGRWVLKTNLKSTTVSFATGLEGMIPMIGDVISVADNFWSSNLALALSGRVMEVSGLQVFTYFKVDARPGDKILINKPDGSPVARTIANVSPDGKTITLNVGFGFDVDINSVFAIDRADIALQQYVVSSITKGDGDDEFCYSITAVEYDPNKYDEIDYGVNIDDRPTSIVDPDNMKAPENVVVSSYSRVVQGMSVETMVIGWDKAQFASYYDVQWRKDNGNWINIPRTANTEVEVEGIYQGTYHVRVRSISSAMNTSPWSSVRVVSLTGKVGEQNAPVNLTATTDEILGIRIKWGMPPGSGDTAYIELHQSQSGMADDSSLVSMVPYPGYEYWHSPLTYGYVNFYRVRAVDRIGNVSAWTDFVRGMVSDDADQINDYIKIDIEGTEGFKELAESALDNASKIKEQAQSILQDALANDGSVRMIKKESGARKASFTQAVTLIANETEARVQAMQELKAQIDDEVVASITEVQDALVTETEARTNADLALSARVGDTEAALTEKLDAWVDSAGAGTMYTMNMGLKYQNVEYRAGWNMQLVAGGNGVFAQTMFDVDRFAVGRIAGGTISQLPFVIEGNQVIMREAFIGNGTITNAKIGNFIQSNNYQWNVSGWHLGKDGTFLNFGSTPGEGAMKQDSQTISVRDGNGVLRVQIGRLTGYF